MSARKVVGRAAPVAVVGLLALSAFAVERSKGLDPAVLSQSRGNNDGSLLSNIPSPHPSPCSVPNAACSVCQRGTYVVTIGPGGPGAGYFYGAPNSNQCGVVRTGTCNAAFACTTLQPGFANCFATPTLPPIQP